jgi:mRNA-degrading endonuclease toxin of MazEF toxin-antitoxin module
MGAVTSSHPMPIEWTSIVQNDRNNGRLRNTTVAMVTGNTRLAAKEPAQLFIDPATPDGKASGLLGPSAVKCENGYTVAPPQILRGLGHLTPTQMEGIGACLRSALAL